MQEICKVIAQILESFMEDVVFGEDRYDDDLTELGMDSILFIHVIVEIEERFETELPDEYLVFGELNTIRRMAEVVYQL